MITLLRFHFAINTIFFPYSIHSELLVYDWSESGDTEVVVEDIERLDFEKYGKNDLKMSDWQLPDEDSWIEKRLM